jgi:hypothetical protein
MSKTKHVRWHKISSLGTKAFNEQKAHNLGIENTNSTFVSQRMRITDINSIFTNLFLHPHTMATVDTALLL